MLTVPPPPNVQTLATTLFARLTEEFPSLEELYHTLTTSDPELRQLADSPELTAKIELTIKLANLRFQILTAQCIDAGITALMKVLEGDKPETIRRAANTLLQIAGILPPKQPAPKPWEKPPQNPTPENDITKQHLPTYNNLPTTESSPRAGTPSSRRPAAAEPPTPTTTPQRHPNLPTTKSSITKPHLPTYVQLATQAIAQSLPTHQT